MQSESGGAVTISIHVPREGDDRSEKKVQDLQIYFNPRPP